MEETGGGGGGCFYEVQDVFLMWWERGSIFLLFLLERMVIRSTDRHQGCIYFFCPACVSVCLSVCLCLSVVVFFTLSKVADMPIQFPCVLPVLRANVKQTRCFFFEDKRSRLGYQRLRYSVLHLLP